MPTKSTEELLSVTELFMEDPEGAVVIFTTMGFDITAEEAKYLTAGDFFSITLILDADLPDFSSAAIEIGEAIIDGETAIVPVTINGSDDQVELFIEDGSWKLVNSVDGILQ